MISYIKNKKGFTIVELIIAVTLLTLVLTMGYMVFSTLSKNFDMGVDQSYVQQNIRFVDDYFKNTVRNIGEFYIGETKPADADMEYFLFVEEDTAKTEGAAITDSVLTDISVKVDRSGEYIVLDYVITGEDGNQTYEINNKIILNNIPSDMLSEEYDGYISLKTKNLFFNYDPVFLTDRRLISSPQIITTGQVYDEFSPLILNLIVKNDSFLDNITKLDIHLAGLDGLSIIEPVSRETNEIIVLQLTGNTNGLVAGNSGTIKVVKAKLAGETDLTVGVPIQDPEAAYMVIQDADGNDVYMENIEIPLDGETLTVDYTAVVLDQGENEFTPMTGDITWQYPANGTYVGVSCGITNDTLSITLDGTELSGLSELPEIMISANLYSKPIVSYEFTIILTNETP